MELEITGNKFNFFQALLNSGEGGLKLIWSELPTKKIVGTYLYYTMGLSRQ